jgi:hypothetical protein
VYQTDAAAEDETSKEGPNVAKQRKSLRSRAAETRKALERPKGPAGKAGQAIGEAGIKGVVAGRRKKK